MNRPLTAVMASLEALLVFAIGIAIPLVPLTIMWAVQFGFAIDWRAFWRASVDIWLVGHGADLLVRLDGATASAVGVSGASAPVQLTIAALGFALITVLLAARAGRRITEAGYRILGGGVAIAVFAALSLGATLTSLSAFARVSIWQGTLLPTVMFGAGLAIGLLRANARLPRAETRQGTVPSAALTTLTVSVRGAAAAAALICGCASLIVAGLFLVNYARMISLYESLHTELLGGVVVTLGELAFLPNLIVFAASWIIGPGFALGAGSSVTPIATSLGPLPVIPIFGAIPPGEHSLGYLGLLVPVVAGFLAGVVVRQRSSLPSDWVHRLCAGLGMGVVAGLMFAALAWAASGSAGPGRLVDVGSDPLSVGVAAALEIGVAATIGVFVGRARADNRPR